MCTPLTISLDLDDPDGRLMPLPIIDHLWFDAARHAYVATLIPHETVSADEKEVVTVGEATSEGRRIAAALGGLVAALGAGSLVTRLIHGGGAHFTFHLANGHAIELANGQLTAGATLDAIRLLRDIGQAAEIAFVLQSRAAA